MRKIIFCNFLLLFPFCSLLAQSVDTSSIKEGLTFKINPCQLGAGEIRMLLERKVNQRNSVEYVVGFYPPYSFIEMYGGARLFDGRIGFKTGIAYRHYYGEHQSYITPSFFYKFMSYDSAPWEVAENSFYFGLGSYESNANTLSQTSSLKKHIFSVQFDIGDKYILSKHVTLDMYWGLGARLKYERWPSYSHSFSEDIIVRPSMQFGINLGYKK